MRRLSWVMITVSRGAFHSTKIPVGNFGNSTCSMERHIPVAQTRPKPQRVWFAPNTNVANAKVKKKMADSMPVLLALELLDDSKIKVDEFFDDSDDVIHLSVACCFMRRHLNLVPNFLKPLFHRISLMSLRFTFEWPDRLFNYLLKTSWPQEEYQSVIHLEEHLFHLQNKS